MGSGLFVGYYGPDRMWYSKEVADKNEMVQEVNRLLWGGARPYVHEPAYSVDWIEVKHFFAGPNDTLLQ